ncbi:MAG: hypothetical protein WC799_21015 [Desulfobacteraceae bacterium]
MKKNLIILSSLIALSIMVIGFSSSMQPPFTPDTVHGGGGVFPSFDGHGKISHIALHHNSISVNGVTYRLKPEADLFTSTRENASSCWFLKGDTVGYTLDEHRHITSLWLLEQSHKNLK